MYPSKTGKQSKNVAFTDNSVLDIKNRFSVLQTSHGDSIPFGIDSADNSNVQKVNRKKGVTTTTNVCPTLSKSDSSTSVQNGFSYVTSGRENCVTKVSDNPTFTDTSSGNSSSPHFQKSGKNSFVKKCCLHILPPSWYPQKNSSIMKPGSDILPEYLKNIDIFLKLVIYNGKRKRR